MGHLYIFVDQMGLYEMGLDEMGINRGNRHIAIATLLISSNIVKIAIGTRLEKTWILFAEPVCQTFESRLDKYRIEGTGEFG